MNRQEFSSNAQVRDFVAWAGTFECDADGHLVPSSGGALSTLAVALDIPKSAKVPVAVSRRSPIGELTRWYSWRANGMATGDFAETRATVAGLTQAIRGARTRESAVAAIERILWWGGNRNSAVGALPFLLARPDLVAYLDQVKVALNLEQSVATPDGLSSVLGMNSMLTKVHAFNSEDGLPIYDSRVAGAVATLVESWRRASGFEGQPLPAVLSFPEVGGGGERRGVRSRFPGCITPPALYYGGKSQSTEVALRNARVWASAKVRLGWLLSELLVKPSPDGMRSLEACLFMAGYDCAGINR